MVEQLPSYSTLHETGWDQKIVCLSKSSLPVIAEVQHKGRIQCCALLDIQFPTTNKLPRFLVQPLWDGNYSSIAPTNTTTAIETSQCKSSIEPMLVDVGQLTSVWGQPKLNPLILPKLRQLCATLGALPSRQVDRALTKLHQQCTQHRRKKANIHICSPFEGGSTNKPLPPLSETIDSMVLMQELQSPPARPTSNENQYENTHSIRALAQRASIASSIGELGLGKFKRMPCRVLDVQPPNGDHDSHDHGDVHGNDDTQRSVVLLNGGWHSVSRSIVATTEGRASALSRAARNTQADQNILWKLEYLAMSTSTTSSSLSSHPNQGNEQKGEDQMLLQPDVREFLKAMGFSLDRSGARQALVELGIWSQDHVSLNQSTTGPTTTTLPVVNIQPWSKQILQDVKWYKKMDKQRKKRFFQHLQQGHRPVDDNGVSGNKGALEGRTNLSLLPSVCVDAARATFRDDALGLRSRTETGRPVIGGNEWEILIHVVDVSDLYSTEVVKLSPRLQRLSDAAASRGGRRFDHSTGPIHMLPPALLEVLSLQSVPLGGNDTTIRAQGLNRCVSVWVYIDEETGKVLDSGVERTLIAPPVALSFQLANNLLEGNLAQQYEHLSLNRSKFILTQVETLLDKWESYVTNRSRSAQERKEHALVSGMVAHEFDGSLQQSQAKDQEGRGFELQRGYRLVDKALRLYGHIVSKSLKQSQVALPFVAGTQDKGRVATAPLRRYIDGQAQRQILATLCHYGGPPMNRHECAKVGIHATSIANAASNLRPFKDRTRGISERQRKAIRALAHKIATTGSSTLAARSLGKRNEVVILGVGAVAKCDGLEGGGSDNGSPLIETGQKVLVSIVDIDERKGLANAKLLQVVQRKY